MKIPNVQSQHYFLPVLLFLCACAQNAPEPAPAFADAISGTWRAHSVTFEDVVRHEWANFKLVITNETGESGMYYAMNIPTYPDLDDKGVKRMGIWPDTSAWYLDNPESPDNQTFVRSDGIHIQTDTLNQRLFMNYMVTGWQEECDPEKEGGCPLGFFGGDWHFEMIRLE